VHQRGIYKRLQNVSATKKKADANINSKHLGALSASSAFSRLFGGCISSPVASFLSLDYFPLFD